MAPVRNTGLRRLPPTPRRQLCRQLVASCVAILSQLVASCVASCVAAAAPIPPGPPLFSTSPAAPTAKLALGDIPAPTPTPASASSGGLAPVSVMASVFRISLRDDGYEDGRRARDARGQQVQPEPPHRSDTRVRRRRPEGVAAVDAERVRVDSL